MDLLTWDSVLDAMERSSDWDLPMGGTHGVHFGHDGRAGCLFVRVPAPSLASAPPTRLRELGTRLVAASTERWLEIFTSERAIFREFHRFAGLFTEDLERGASPLAAFDSALQRWRLLASERRLLSPEQQLGLLGELLLLHSLVLRDGPLALRAWTARDPNVPDRHDFRLSSCDIEVKTTRLQRRRHVIHGLHQLAPAGERPLFVLSLMFRPAGLGEGLSLRAAVDLVRANCARDEASFADFASRLDATGYREEDADHYTERLALNEPPMLITVDDKCPRITPALLAAPAFAGIKDRIGDVTYTVDLTGLGDEPGSPTWSRHLSVEVRS